MSHGLYSCPTKILKCVNNTIGDVLADIINRSIAFQEYRYILINLKGEKLYPYDI